MKEVEAALSGEIDRLKSDPPTQAELTRALAKFEKRTYSRLTSPQGRAFVLAIGFAEKDDPAYYRRDIARYFTVTPADVARVAAKYLVPEKVVLDVVPLKPGEAKAKAVQVGPEASAARRGGDRRAFARPGPGLVEDAGRRGTGPVQAADGHPQDAQERREGADRAVADPADRHGPLAHARRHGRRSREQGGPGRPHRDLADQGHEGQDRERAGRSPRGPGRELRMLGGAGRDDALVRRPVAEPGAGAGLAHPDLRRTPARPRRLRARAWPPGRRADPGPRQRQLARRPRLPGLTLRCFAPVRTSGGRHGRDGQVDRAG